MGEKGKKRGHKMMNTLRWHHSSLIAHRRTKEGATDKKLTKYDAIGLVDQSLPLPDVLAQFVRDGYDLEIVSFRQSVAHLKSGGSSLAVDEYLLLLHGIKRSDHGMNGVGDDWDESDYAVVIRGGQCVDHDGRQRK